MAHGDSTAFGELYRMSAPGLLSHAWRFVRSREAAEEVVQESFIGIWRNAGHFDQSRSQAMTWMSTIVRFKSLDYLRGEKRYRLGPGDHDANGDQPDTAMGPEAAAEMSQQIVIMNYHLASLHPSQRKVIELAYFSELSHSEVAREMIAPLGTVKTHIRRGCASLRKHFESHAIQGQQ
ncbi:RNA polymerase sigma factor [Massilia yuzhufengensis]|nr:sigma-70 family RNA polymerase sigma factor [Massilia yuzhufengensis]